MDNYRFSLVIPHHNIPDLLKRCLRSIPIRKDLQIIVVDDCSEKAIQERLREMESDFSYVQFVYSDICGGAGKARNLGMDRASGDYLFFADADDFFSNRLPEVLDRTYTEDIVYFRNKNVLSEDSSVEVSNFAWMNDVFDRYFQNGEESEIRCALQTPWAKFFRRAFIEEKGLRFEERPYANDIYFVVSAGCQAERIRVEDILLYYYTFRKGSLSADFATKPGELDIRAEATFKASEVMKANGYHLHLMPTTYYYSRFFHENKKMYRHYLSIADKVYQSRWQAITQVRWLEPGVLGKLWVYVYSLFCLI
jgi:glycosyltransferase involved in cell wall biosynthesis